MSVSFMKDVALFCIFHDQVERMCFHIMKALLVFYHVYMAKIKVELG